MVPELKDGETVLTGLLEDRSAVFGALAQIEALGLELLDLRHVEPGRGFWATSRSTAWATARCSSPVRVCSGRPAIRARPERCCAGRSTSALTTSTPRSTTDPTS